MEKIKWLDVEPNHEVQVNTLQSCLTLCDLTHDNYMKLVTADISQDKQKPSKLMVFKGTILASEHSIPGIPSAIQSLYIDEPEPKTPILAVAIGESILFYRNMKPYFKYTLPPMNVDEKEKEIWRKLPVERAEGQEILIESLKLFSRNQLTRVSQKLLQLSTQERHNFIMEHADTPLQKFSSVVAMDYLQRVSIDTSFPPSCLVLATEHGEIFILDSQGFSILYQARTCSYETTPSLISVQGQYESDFRIVIATRNGAVHLLRKSWLEGKEIFKLNYPLAGLVLVPIDETIAVASMDKQLTCYSKKGKQLYGQALEEIPICLIPICLSHLGLTMVCVSMVGGLVQLFIQKSIVDQFKMEETVTSMIFGPMGREEYVLTLITESCNIFIKILKRNAAFDAAGASVSGKEADDNAVSLLEKPKKSSIFIEQSLREKLNAKATYGSFQVELWRLRHTAARATVEAINSAESMISGDVAHAPIKVAAEVCGAGPIFRLFLTIQNLSSYKVATNLRLLLHADRRHYKIAKSMAMLPAILPGSPLKVDFEVIALFSPENNGLPPLTLTKDNSIVRIIIAKLNQSKPLIAAVIAMPESEPSLEAYLT